MEVTLFAEEEKTSLVEGAEEWKEKCRELGLKGQITMMDSSGGAPNPFRRMDIAMIRMVEVLCPVKADVELYDSEPIPMGVLGAYGLAKLKGYFKQVLIHYSPGRPDPFMVGLAGNGEQFLMAHWGPERYDLETLMRKARKVWVDGNMAKVRQGLAEWAIKVDHMESLATEYFVGSWVHIPF